MKRQVDKVMKLLEKYYKYHNRTTLNRMRKEKKPNPYKILISCLLSLRTKDETTEKVVKKLFSVAKTPKQIVKMPRKKLEKLIYSSGYYKNKARTIKYVSKILIEKYKGKVPDDKEKLLEIKGIGPKTANVVLNFAFNQLVIPVDVNVHRISNRLGWVKTKTAEKTEPALEKILAKKYWRELNALFVLFGKDICVPISPKCSICPVKKYCPRIGVINSR
jgi:endonuclease-3